MSTSAAANRSTRAATRDRLASELRALVATHGPSIALDWLDRSTPWQAHIVGTDRFVTRNAMRYWAEQGWARRTEAKPGGRFTLEVDVDMLPQDAAKESA